MAKLQLPKMGDITSKTLKSALKKFPDYTTHVVRVKLMHYFTDYFVDFRMAILHFTLLPSWAILRH